MSTVLPQVRSRREAGFTLLELLVVLTLLGLLTILMAGEIRFGLRAWERGNVHAEDLEEIQLAHGFFRRQLSQAYPLRTFESGRQQDDRHAVFAGAQEQLRFAVVAPERFGIGAFQILELALVPGDRGTDLQVSWRPYHPGIERGDSEDHAAHRSVLLRDVEAIALSYFGAIEPERPATWHDQWVDPVRLPQLIRLDLRFTQTKRFWPELIVAPQMGQH